MHSGTSTHTALAQPVGVPEDGRVHSTALFEGRHLKWVMLLPLVAYVSHAGALPERAVCASPAAWRSERSWKATVFRGEVGTGGVICPASNHPRPFEKAPSTTETGA